MMSLIVGALLISSFAPSPANKFGNNREGAGAEATFSYQCVIFAVASPLPQNKTLAYKIKTTLIAHCTKSY